MRAFSIFLPVWLFLGATLTWAAERTVIIVSPDSHPYAYREEGKIKGVFHDLAVEAFRHAGIAVEIRLMPWARCMEEVKAGRADGLFVVYRTAEREKIFDFPEEYLAMLEETVFTRRADNLAPIHDFSALRGKRVGVLIHTVHGANFDRAVEEGLFAPQQVSSYGALVEMLSSDHLDAVLGVSDAVIDAVLNLNLSREIRVNGPALDHLPAYLVFSKVKGLQTVRLAFDRAMRTMHEDGSYDRIIAAYPAKKF